MQPFTREEELEEIEYDLPGYERLWRDTQALSHALWHVELDGAAVLVERAALVIRGYIERQRDRVRHLSARE